MLLVAAPLQFGTLSIQLSECVPALTYLLTELVAGWYGVDKLLDGS